MKRTLIALLLVFLFANFQGCILVPFIESFKSTGALQSDRENLLRERLTYFHRARFWGEPHQALAFLTPEAKTELNHIFKSRDDEKIVDTKVQGISFDADSYKADVLSEVKYFNTSYNVIQKRRENQRWTFSITGGWKLKSLDYND